MPNASRRCTLKSCAAYQRASTMIRTPAGSFCNFDHAYQYAAAKSQKMRQKEERVKTKEHKQRKQEFKQNDYSKQFGLTKRVAQKLANLLDRELPCICCGEPRGTAQFCGGHYKTVGGHPEAALDIRNIHGQRNRLCNMEKSGNISGDKHSVGFKAGIVARYGQQLVDYLDSYKPPKKCTCDELIAMRKEYSAEIRRLERGEPASRDWRKLPQQEEAK